MPFQFTAAVRRHEAQKPGVGPTTFYQHWTRLDAALNRGQNRPMTVAGIIQAATELTPEERSRLAGLLYDFDEPDEIQVRQPGPRLPSDEPTKLTVEPFVRSRVKS